MLYCLLLSSKYTRGHEVEVLHISLVHTKYIFQYTGKSLSEALIFASTNPQVDNRLFIELQVQYMKIPSSEHVVYRNCF